MLSFRHTKQTSKNVADTTFKVTQRKHKKQFPKRHYPKKSSKIRKRVIWRNPNKIGYFIFIIFTIYFLEKCQYCKNKINFGIFYVQTLYPLFHLILSWTYLPVLPETLSKCTKSSLVSVLCQNNLLLALERIRKSSCN